MTAPPRVARWADRWERRIWADAGDFAGSHYFTEVRARASGFWRGWLRGRT